MSISSSKDSPLKSIIAGSIAGMASVLVCHPLDSLRTRIQVLKDSSMNSLLFNKSTSVSLSTLYKGIIPPLLAQSAYKSTIFTTNNICNQYIFKYKISTFSLLVSGLISGTVNSVLVSPIELIRSHQILSENSSASIISCTRNIIKEAGLLSLWRALPLTVLRDGPGVALYLYTFSELKSIFAKRKGSLSLLDRIISGSFAGVAFWVYALPVDSLKTILESKTLVNDSKMNLSTYKRIASIYNEVGVYYLYRSWPTALGRGLPGAAITLTTYDALLEYLNKYQS